MAYSKSCYRTFLKHILSLSRDLKSAEKVKYENVSDIGTLEVILGRIFNVENFMICMQTCRLECIPNKLVVYCN